MRRYPKIALGFLVLLIIFIVFVVKASLTSNLTFSSFTISPTQNKFNLALNLAPADENVFSKVIETLGLPSSTKQGLSFELDGTSSARLAFISPVTGKIVPRSSSVSFQGNIANRTQAKETLFQSFSFPKDLNFAIGASDLTPSVKNYLDIPDTFLNTLSQTNGNHAQYIAIFGQNADAVFIFKTGTFDIESLKDFAAEKNQEYKEETQDDITIHLLKGITAFEIGDWTYFTSSLDAARKVIGSQKQPKNAMNFPHDNFQKGNYALLFRNNQGNPAPETLMTKIFGSKNKIPKFINNVSEIQFTLKDKVFSALMEVK